MNALLQQLVQDIAAQLRTLRERDGVVITDEQICERARSIVTLLVGLYDVRPSAPPVTPFPSRVERAWCFTPVLASASSGARAVSKP